MPVRPEVEKNIRQDINPAGVQFLGQHKLQLILSTQFIPPVGKPWIDATDYTIQIKDGHGSTMCRGGVSIENLLNGLAEYEGSLAESIVSSLKFHLNQKETMEVKFGNMEWYEMFLSLDRLIPGTVIWPEKT